MLEVSEAILAGLIRRRAEQQPDLDVLTFEHFSLGGATGDDEVRTYGQLQTRGNSLAAALIALGMERGDRFALMMANHPEFVETMIASSIAATTYVPIDPRTRGEKLTFLLDNAGCRGAICADYCLEQILAASRELDRFEWLLVLETGRSTLPASATDLDIRPLSEALSTLVPTVDVRLENPDDPLQILYTSGTTGDPKGVVFPNERFGGFASLGALLGYQSDERPYTGLSLTHGNAQAVTLGPSLAMGLRAVFSRRFTKSHLWDVTRLYGGTAFSLLGGMATAIYSEPQREDDSDNPVRFVISAGMPAAIWESFEKRFAVQVFEWYGAVEGGLAFKPIGVGPVGSFGKPAPTLEMKVLDEQDRECPPGAIGEICSRPADGSGAAVEYYGNPEASASKTRGGWLRSGDMGHTDEQGWLFFDYRKGGGIRHNGDFVHAGFVEKVLAEHPDVDDVFVYGVPAASRSPGEKDVVAAIVPRDFEHFDAVAVFAHCRQGLESNFVPSYLQLVPEIPKTASEKPQERFLLEGFDPEAGNVRIELGASVR